MREEISETLSEINELADACKNGNLDRVIHLLKKHPEVLDSPDRDERFHYPSSFLWSPLYLASMNGHEKLVKYLLDNGANPVPYEVAAQYHHHTYWDWTNTLRQRGYEQIVQMIEKAIQQRYGPLMESISVRQAVLDGNIEQVQKLILENPDIVHQVDIVGNTLLHLAVASNQLELVRLFVENGASIDAKNGDGRTPSVVSIFGLHRYWRDELKEEILEYLLKNGAEYTLLIASTIGDERRVREILETEPHQANKVDPCYRRPLSGAVSGGHVKIVEMLLKHGADPNAKEAICQGGLSLRIAADRGDAEIVRLLLEYGANPNHWVDSSGDAMYAAYVKGHNRILQMLYANGGTMELQVYAANHRIDVIAEVLRLDPSKANDVFPYGWEDNGDEELAYDIMKLAIRYGARFENATAWSLRWTLLKYPKVFKLLLQHGANPNLPLLGMAGDMSRRYKNMEERLQAMRFLLEECGANINCQDEEGFTPLALAAREGFEEIVELLLSKGAHIETNAPSWAQPLFLAENNGHQEIARLLREQKS